MAQEMGPDLQEEVHCVLAGSGAGQPFLTPTAGAGAALGPALCPAGPGVT